MKRLLFFFFFSVAACEAGAWVKLPGFRLPYLETSGYLTDILTDTVFFDFGQAACSGTTMDIPVSFRAGSDRYALDFAMKYDLTRLSYNSIIVHEPGLIASAYYNAPDSTLRFTSFCFSPLSQSTYIVSIRFNCLSGSIHDSDMDTVIAYLDGNRCSYKILPSPLPAAIAPSGPAEIAPGDSLLLTATGGTGFTYAWSTGATSQGIYSLNPGTYSVTVTRPGGCTSVAAVYIASGSPLPVELLSFEAKVSGKEVELSWATATETDNDYFEIQRSPDGYEWTPIAVIDGAGHSSVTLYYTFTDFPPYTGVCYYRLIQADFDARSRCIGTLAVKVIPVNLSFSVGPNPATDRILVASGTNGKIEVISAAGGFCVLKTTLPAGQEQELFLGRLPAGIYIVRLLSEDTVAEQKILVTP